MFFGMILFAFLWFYVAVKHFELTCLALPKLTNSPPSFITEWKSNGVSGVVFTWMSLGMTSVPFLALCAEAALLTYFFSRKKVTSQVMKATLGARYWSLVQKVLSLFRVTGTYKGLGL